MIEKQMYDVLGKTQIAARQLEQAVLVVPTGTTRNALTEANIHLQSALQIVRNLHASPDVKEFGVGSAWRAELGKAAMELIAEVSRLVEADEVLRYKELEPFCEPVFTLLKSGGYMPPNASGPHVEYQGCIEFGLVAVCWLGDGDTEHWMNVHADGDVEVFS